MVNNPNYTVDVQDVLRGVLKAARLDAGLEARKRVRLIEGLLPLLENVTVQKTDFFTLVAVPWANPQIVEWVE